MRSAISVCLIGRLGDARDVPLLSEIAFDENELSRPMYETSETNGKNAAYFQMMSHSLAALVKIHKRHGLDVSRLKESIEDLLISDKAIKRVFPSENRSPNVVFETVSLLEYLLNEIK